MITLLMFAVRACGVGSDSVDGTTSLEQLSRLPKTMLARVGTGEGKSLIIGMLAAFLAKKNMRAHVINTDRTLAQRDFDANVAFFNTLGIRAGTSHADLKNKRCMIVYCTGGDVEKACLDSLTEGKIVEYQEGLKDAILIV